MLASINLLIDTTVDGATIGLATRDDGRLLGYRNIPGATGNSSSLNTLLADVLREHEYGLDSLNRIVVAQGPGSFTGIKVGLSFAYGLRLSVKGNRPIAGFSPLAELCRLDVSQRLWVLGATRERGAAAKRQQEQVDLADFDLRQPGTWPDQGVMLVKPWPELQVLLEAGQVPYSTLMLDDYHSQTMEFAASFSVHETAFSTDELPQPVYLRQSTAEERLNAQAR